MLDLLRQRDGSGKAEDHLATAALLMQITQQTEGRLDIGGSGDPQGTLACGLGCCGLADHGLAGWRGAIAPLASSQKQKQGCAQKRAQDGSPRGLRWAIPGPASRRGATRQFLENLRAHSQTVWEIICPLLEECSMWCVREMPKTNNQQQRAQDLVVNADEKLSLFGRSTNRPSTGIVGSRSALGRLAGWGLLLGLLGTLGLAACSEGGKDNPQPNPNPVVDMGESDGSMVDPSKPSIAVNKGGMGAGVVTSTPQGISCGGACAANFVEGQKVVLTAQPDGNSLFGGWGGACMGADPAANPPTCTLTASGKQEVKVTFNKRANLDKVCSDPNWCWNSPLPQGNNLYRVWGASDTDAWAVGDMGTILHWNGVSWSQSPSGTQNGLYSVWGRAANDVWAVGEAGTILHWNGVKWEPQLSTTSNDLFAIWGTSAEVWAVGYASTTLRWDGTKWDDSKACGSGLNLYAIWGTGPNEVWSFGTGRYYCKFNGTAWSYASDGSLPYTVRGVYGIDGKNMWAVGDDGYISKWNGSSWNLVASGMTGRLNSVFGTGDKNIWAVGHDGVILLYNGTAWSVVAPPGAQSAGLMGVWGSGANSIWVVGGNGTMKRWTGAPPWEDVAQGTRKYIRGAWGTAENNLWAVGESGWMMRWDGTAWKPYDSKVTEPLQAIHGSGPNDIWAVGSAGAITHWNGTDWMQVTTSAAYDLTAVYAAAPDKAWAATSSSYVLQWDGTRWSPVYTGALLYSMWGESASNIWAGSSGGRMYRYNGSTWTAYSTGVSADWMAVYGVDDKNVWAAGSSGQIVRWNGTAWSSAIVGNDPNVNFRALWGSSASRVFAVGDAGVVYRWDGVAWSATKIARANLNAVTGFAADKVWTFGSGGAVLRWNP